jgi:Ca2+-transporting ATPase
MPSEATQDAARSYQRSVDDLLATLESDPKRGLDAAEAARRAERYGPNQLPTTPPTPAWRRFIAQFRDVLTILLLVATVISFIAWLIERSEPVPFEAIAILAIVLVNAVLGFVQENRAEQAVAALQAMASPHARVLREGTQQTVETSALVPGDVLLIEEGDTLPADGRVIESIALRVAESALTGESSAVSKDTAPLDSEVGIGDQSNMIFSGTAVSSGRGRALITAIGAQTEIGKIAGSLQQAEDEATPLQRELDRTGRLLGIVVVSIAVVMSATILLIEGIGNFSALVDVLILAVSLAVAAVPEGLTAITTIVLSLGMQRMARRNVIVRKLSAVETLGSTTVVCSDKTGTLTKNEMTVRTLITASGRVDLTGIGYAPEGQALHDGQPLSDGPLRTEVRRTLRAADLANNAQLVQDGERWNIQGDPTEGALLVAARKVGLTDRELGERFPRVGEVPFTSERKLMTTAHTDAEHGEQVMVFAKGAPDILLARCTEERVGGDTRPLSDERRNAILAAVDQLAEEALRTLGVAYRTLRRDAGSGELSEDVEQEFVFLGVLGMIDPPREEAKQSVKEAIAAGVRPVMITGDHPITAAAIATELGIIPREGKTIAGGELQKIDDDALREMVKTVSVYARVAPEHKLRIVRALKANGEIAAMTGDGVNDAPALKAADIGVAMGITGTDVSKGSADMILTDDNFASIVAAVEEGRSIFANIQKFLRYLLSSNIGEVLVMFLGVLLAGMLGITSAEGAVVIAPLLATQILWINLLTDAGPALALGVEPADHGVMDRPPRDPRTGVITRAMWVDIVVSGIIMAIGTLTVMDWALVGGFVSRTTPGELAYGQTMAFTTLVCFQLFNALNSRFFDRSVFSNIGGNMWLWGAIAISLALQVLVLYVPFLQAPFGTVPLSLNDWLVCLGVGSIILWFGEAEKLITRGRRHAHRPVQRSAEARG